MSGIVTIPANGWKPRDYQMPSWGAIERGCKRVLTVWHRRAGKDEICLQRAAVGCMEKAATYWHMLPQAAQARKAIWEAVNPHTGKRRIDEVFPVQIRDTTREQEMFIRFKNGSTYQVVGSDNYNSLVGSPPFGVVFSEWALADPAAWGYIRPILEENGGWAFFNTTPRGNNHVKAMVEGFRTDPDWFVEVLSAEKTGVFTQEQLDSIRKEMLIEHGVDAGEALFNQEYLCSFDAAILGAYYAGEIQQAEKQGRVKANIADPYLEVMTAWDLGVSDMTSIWFIQAHGNELRLIDYYEGSGVGLDHYAKVLQDKGYRYGTHYLPHDTKVKELGSGRSREEVLRQLGITPKIVPAQSVADGINAVRRMFPQFWIDANTDAGKRGLDCLKNYCRDYDDKNKVWRNSPRHDWASHGSDALRTFACGYKPKQTYKPMTPKIGTIA